jgi:hypothetical protein
MAPNKLKSAIKIYVPVNNGRYKAVTAKSRLPAGCRGKILQ